MISKTEYIERELKRYPKADRAVIEFIADFKYNQKNVETIEKLFSSGYCWYFAHMLQQAFGRGKVCYVYFKEHFVWLDDLAYDIFGVNEDWECLIPEEKLNDYVLDFKHIRGVQSAMTEGEIAGMFLDIVAGED